MAKKIIVVGSSNTDMVLKTARFPKPGETIIGGNFFVFQGGKGANQAVAAARAGGSVQFICRVGNDPFGLSAVQHYRAEGIDVSRVVADEKAPTGVAVITVNAEGENSIIVASGANAFLHVDDVAAALESGEEEWLITQLETPLDVITYVATYAREGEKKLVLNPAPAATLPDDVYKGLFLITPNETETALLTGIEVTDKTSAQKAASVFRGRGVQNIIITLGSKGAYVDAENYKGIIASPKVTAVDTTAAGDVFNGALIVALSEGQEWEPAVQFACKAAAISVTRMGAQTSAPVRSEIDA